MKKQPIKLNQALSLDKETITKLNEEQLGNLEGGQDGIFSITCNHTKLEDEVAGESCIACSCNHAG
jgi:hypothetical protein